MRRHLALIAVLLLVCCASLSGIAAAHESQPGLLELRQLSASRYEVIWRAPIYYGKPHPARLQLPENWKTIGEPSVTQLPDSILHRRVVDVQGDSSDSSVIRFPGLETTINLINFLFSSKQKQTSRKNEQVPQKIAWNVQDYLVKPER